MISKAISAVIACFVVTAVADVRAAVIFSEIRTGAELATHPYVTFPTVTPTVSGASLDFGPGVAADVLLRWDLLPAASRGALHFEITIEYEGLSSDSDPRFGISDGSNWQGGSRTDQGFFTSQWASHDATTVINEFWSSWCESLGAHVPSNPMSWEIDVAAGGSGPNSLANYQEGAGFCAGPVALGGNHLDEDQTLGFVLYRDTVNGAEEYRIDSISVVVSDDSPVIQLPALSRACKALLLGLLLVVSFLTPGARGRDRARASASSAR